MILLFQSGAAQQYTLTADASSYSLAGTVAALKVGRKVAANSASYTATGTAVNLKRALKVAANAVSYVLTVNIVSLVKGRKLSADQASFSYNPTGASIRYARVMPAANGSYSYTPSNADLVRAVNRVLTAESANFYVGGKAMLKRIHIIRRWQKIRKGRVLNRVDTIVYHR